MSLHATKLYHSVEGGLIITTHRNLIKTLTLMRNFGHDGPYKFSEVGINGKNSELHAAMGLLNLKYLDGILLKRKALVDLYIDQLEGLPISLQSWRDKATKNYAYMPILFETEEQLVRSMKRLTDQQIFSRRYFYPLLDTLPYLTKDKSLKVGRGISERILCLPLYYDLSIQDVTRICKLIAESF